MSNNCAISAATLVRTHPLEIMPDCTATTPATTRHCTPDAAQLPAASPGIARESGEAPDRWCIECTRWTSSRGDGDRIGYADLLIDGRLSLRDARLVRRLGGSVIVLAPHQYAKNHGSAGQQPRPCFSIPDEADRRAFDAAAVEAVRRFAPSALPNVTLNSETRCAPTVAAATQGSD